MLLTIMLRCKSCLKTIKVNKPDAKKELEDIDNKFDEARVAKPVTGRGEFIFHIWILCLSEVCAVS